jgi:multicomponent Na+:H+ antiporter subunit E
MQTQETDPTSFRSRPVLHGVGLVIILGLLWMLLSGFFLPLMLALGAASVALTVWLAWRMKLIDAEGVPIHLASAVLLYFPWLVVEIVKANIDVARRVLSPDLRISPKLFTTPASQQSDLGLAIYANSITLTPGTVAVDLEPGEIVVHALSQEGAEDVLAGEMDRRVVAAEGLGK